MNGGGAAFGRPFFRADSAADPGRRDLVGPKPRSPGNPAKSNPVIAVSTRVRGAAPAPDGLQLTLAVERATHEPPSGMAGA